MKKLFLFLMLVVILNNVTTAQGYNPDYEIKYMCYFESTGTIANIAKKEIDDIRRQNGKFYTYGSEFPVTISFYYKEKKVRLHFSYQYYVNPFKPLPLPTGTHLYLLSTVEEKHFINREGQGTTSNYKCFYPFDITKVTINNIDMTNYLPFDKDIILPNLDLKDNRIDQFLEIKIDTNMGYSFSYKGNKL